MCPCSRCLCANSDLLVRQPRGQWVPALRRSHVSSQQNTGQWVQRSGFRSRAVTFVFSQWTLWLTQCWAGYLRLVATWYLKPSQPWRLWVKPDPVVHNWKSDSMFMTCISFVSLNMILTTKKKKEKKRGCMNWKSNTSAGRIPSTKMYSACWNWAVLKSPSGCCR